jgi:predicted HicB family RNase H-like nuclease
MYTLDVFVTFQIKREHDILLRSIREKEATLKVHRRLEATVNNIRATFPSLEEYSEDLVRRLEATRRDARFYKSQTKELRKQIDLAIFEFLEQQGHEGKEKELLAQQRLTNLTMEGELNEKIQESADWSKQMETYNLEKELKVASSFLNIFAF